ncbi:ATP-binding cassette domain-containing protein [Dactylosporangium sp. NPDC051485]|uniref:ABC transporter ATP-binding protein n=1 Tax=Dactylosporangium sp. NPDC051485 TaxID=3154846 RepID=UPI0034290195
MTAPLLRARGLARDYRLPRQRLRGPAPVQHALIDVDLDVAEGEILAVIGESGSGKSTLARLLLALDRPTRGGVEFEGRPIEADRRRLRAGTGIVLQDPYASLDPRFTIHDTVAEPLRALRIPGDHRRLVADVLARVGLEPDRAAQYPHELSGGQRQRVALARAIVHGPRLLIGDEPLSALDVTVRAAIVALLRELNASLGLAVVLVSHDLGLVQHLAARVVVMHGGRIVESGPTGAVLGDPQHAYTRRLVAAVPRLPVRSIDA